MFMNLFMEIYDQHFPHKLKQNETKINKTESPCILGILKSLRNKNKLYSTKLFLRIQTIKKDKNIQNIRIDLTT